MVNVRIYRIAGEFLRIIAIIFSLLSLPLISSCSRTGAPPRVRPVPVSVTPVIIRTVPDQIHIIGNVRAYSTVSVRAQVGGMLESVYFQEGDYVKRGDPLFTIDPRPFQESVREAEATLERNSALLRQTRSDYEKAKATIREAEANVERAAAGVKQARANMEKDGHEEKNAQETLRRYGYLLEKGFTTQEQYDRLRTDAAVVKATLKADREAIKNQEAGLKAVQATLDSSRADLDSKHAVMEEAGAAIRESKASLEKATILLGYCSINSPIEGKTGSLLIHRGNLVKADDTNPLVTINQITPIYVELSVPERQMPSVREGLNARRLRIEAFTEGEQKPEIGAITFIDNAVDSSTGTIRLKGAFPNKTHRLWPGQYVNVVITCKMLHDVPTVPTKALQSGQPGAYVYVLKQGETVELRKVTAGITHKEETVIERGLSAGEQVVTDGQLRLTNGTRVEIKKSGAPAKEGEKR